MRQAVSLLITMFVLTSTNVILANKAYLKLDYTQKSSWLYRLDYKSECVIAENNSISIIDTRIGCKMSAKPSSRGDRMTFTVDSSTVVSKLFDDKQQNTIKSKLSGANFQIALVGGCPMVDTLTTFSVSELSEWDLVIQFAKLLPFVPSVPVRKGYKWEESGVHPLQTTLGTVYCEIYRLYKVDSLSNSGSKAYISWNFSYAAAQLTQDTADILRKVPIEGKGSGTAVINAKERFLERANIRFLTPSASLGSMKIYWRENTELTFLPQ